MTEAMLARFEAEQRALAVMDHPNIARVLEGGVTPQRRLFLVVELIEGQPLTAFREGTKLGLRIAAVAADRPATWPPSIGYRVGKYLQRNRAVLVLVAASLVVGLGPAV